MCQAVRHGHFDAVLQAEQHKTLLDILHVKGACATQSAYRHAVRCIPTNER